MDHMLTRYAEQMLARFTTGPMKFRIYLQPAMALFLAIRGGLQDAKAGKPPYFWGLFTDKGQRESMLKDGWRHIARVFILAIVMDAIYQYIEVRFFYVGEAISVAIILAIIPYLLVRGPVNRLARLDKKIVEERAAKDKERVARDKERLAGD
jgi:hypothetical protein